MALQVILSQKGPLPISAQFQSPGNMQMYLEVTGSVWTPAEDRLIGITIQIDGQAVGAAQIFSNGGSTHRAVVPAYIPIQLGEGAHTLTLTNAADTTSDVNDLFAAVIHY